MEIEQAYVQKKTQTQSWEQSVREIQRHKQTNKQKKAKGQSQGWKISLHWQIWTVTWPVCHMASTHSMAGPFISDPVKVKWEQQNIGLTAKQLNNMLVLTGKYRAPQNLLHNAH